MIKKFIYELTIDTETGEILNSLLKDTDEVKCDNPLIFLEDNKLRLNDDAINFMHLEEDTKLVLRYEDTKNGTVPIIGSNDAFGVANGNRLTKQKTVACRGNNNSELAKYGTEFKVIAHPDKEGLYMLITTDEVESEPEVNTDDLDFNLDGLVDTNEIDSSLFKL